MLWLDLAVDLVAPFEGCHKKIGKLIFPYLDKLAKPAVWTRGFGRTYGITESSPGITEAEAKQELAQGLTQYGLQCVKYSPGLATKPACLAAVASWSWNCGLGAYKVSRLRKAIDEERWWDAAELIKKPNTAGGVVYAGLSRRRNTEWARFVLGLGD